jgi:hypothetical protein
MADENNNSNSEIFDALRRYVPLAAWTIVVLVILIIPLKIVGYGYLPGDDALRHAAKAVSGKPWQEILVLSPAFYFDPNFGWHWLLREIYLSTNWNTESLVVFTVVALFVVSNWSVLACLRRPEAWLAAFILVALVSDLTTRSLLGRPYLLSMSAVMVILFVWQRHGLSPPKWRNIFWMTPLIAMAVFLHGVWYLWALPVAAFFFAGQFRWCFMLATSWIAGTFLGSALTGHPVESILQAIQLALGAVGKHTTQNTLVTELRPSGGEIFTLILIGGVIVTRQLAKLNAVPLTKNPAFWLAAIGWVLGCQTWRFWGDWGLPALLVLVACDLQMFFEARFAEDSFKRLGLVCGLAAALYAVTTNDVNARWTGNLTTQYLSVSEHPDDLAGWLPEKDGIFYSADSSLFFQTFFKNPTGDWRYALGFESTLMTDENFEVYHSFLWNSGDAKSLKPWVDKMRTEDRLVTRGPRSAPPNIPQLEWNYGVSGVWIGRLPRIDTNGAPVTIPATAVRTNVVSLAQ